MVRSKYATNFHFQVFEYKYDSQENKIHELCDVCKYKHFDVIFAEYKINELPDGQLTSIRQGYNILRKYRV